MRQRHSLKLERESAVVDAGQLITIISQAVTLLVIGGGLVATATTTKNNVRDMKDDMIDLKKEIKELAKTMTMVAVQNERLGAMDLRLQTQGERTDENTARIARIESLRYDEMQDRFNRLMTTLEK
jgi:hypothetical protein